MRKLQIGKHTVYYDKTTGFVYHDNRRIEQVGKSAFTDKAIQAAIALADSNDGRKRNGGIRINSGRKLRTTEEQRNRGVFLTDSEYNYLLWKHGGFSIAVRSLFPVGWEFEEC